jgi:hypothetical protein
MKLSTKAKKKFESVDNYLNKLAIVLNCSEGKARRHWKKQSILITTMGVIALVRSETGLSDKELFDMQLAIT